jgi:hypothetical protein
MMELEETSGSCLLYVSSANAKLPGMPPNPAEAPDSEKPREIGLSDDFPREKIDRRIAVAPMMDWTDDTQTSLAIRCLRVYGNACLLYVSSATRVFHGTLMVA